MKYQSPKALILREIKVANIGKIFFLMEIKKDDIFDDKRLNKNVGIIIEKYKLAILSASFFIFIKLRKFFEYKLKIIIKLKPIKTEKAITVENIFEKSFFFSDPKYCEERTVRPAEKEKKIVRNKPN